MPTPTVLTNNVVSAAGTGSTEGPQVILALDDGRVCAMWSNPNGEWTGVRRRETSDRQYRHCHGRCPRRHRPTAPTPHTSCLQPAMVSFGNTIPKCRWAMDPRPKHLTAQLGAHGPVTAMAATGVTTEYGSAQIMSFHCIRVGSLWHSTRAFAGNWRATGNVKDQIGDPGTVVSISVYLPRARTQRVGAGHDRWQTPATLCRARIRLGLAVPQDLFVYINPAQPVIPMVVAAASPAATAGAVPNCLYGTLQRPDRANPATRLPRPAFLMAGVSNGAEKRRILRPARRLGTNPTQARTNPAQFVSPQGLVDGPEPENMA